MGRGIAVLGMLSETAGNGTPDLRDDALPEGITYRDEGCTVAPRCLDCPLPRCRYEIQGGAAAMRRVERNAEIIAEHADGLSIDALAERHHISRRGVFRVLEKAR